MSDAVIRALVERVQRLESDNVEHWQYRKNLFRNAKVKSYDAEKHRAVAVDQVEGEEGFIETNNIKVMSQAGAVKKRTTLSETEHVLVISPNGKVDETSFILPFGPNTDNESPSTHGEEDITTLGDTIVRQHADRVELIAGSSKLIVNTDGIYASHGGQLVKIDAGEVLAKGAKIVTDGKTHLDNGSRQVHYKGGLDSAGDTAIDGASGVFV